MKTQDQTPSGASNKEDPESLVLRGRPQPAVRFRRGLIIGLVGATAASLAAVSWLALQPPTFGSVAAEQRSDLRRPSLAEPLANAPKGYGEIPALGPPLPGDLGRPILEHQQSVAQQQVPLERDFALAEQQRAAEAERARLAAAEQAARSSAVLVQLGGASRALEVARASAAVASEQPAATLENSGAEEAGQPRKIAFTANGKEDRNPHPLVGAPSAWVLSAGTIIPASLVTGLNSDLPGLVIAQVTEQVRDSPTGETILIPQGARLIGSYDSMVAFGQRRALLVWRRIILPDGSSIRLENMPAADLAGYAGVEDGVDFHTRRLLTGIAMSTLLGIGTELTLGSREGDLLRSIRESTQDNVARAGDQLVQRNLDVQPTLRVRPGWPVRAVVHKDLVLKPWREQL